MSEKQFVLSVDPGVSTGIALLSYDEDSPAQLELAWQFNGGVANVIRWVNSHPLPLRFTGSGIYTMLGGIRYDSPKLRIVTEKFTARNTRGFSYTTASLEPLRGEGALIALGLMPDYSAAEKRWRDPKYQYLVGGKDKADKKKRLHKFLKDSGFYVTGGMLGASDADDARSAIGHGLAYIARELKHKPTFDLISSWEN